MRGPDIQVAGLYRYPVKSMGGEAVDSLQIGVTGAVGDRNWAVIDAETGSIKSAKQWPALLGLRARYLTPPAPDAYGAAVSPVEIQAPDSGACRSDDPEIHAWLGERLGRKVRLSPRPPPEDRDHYRLAKARTETDIAFELDILSQETPPDFAAVSEPRLQQLQTFATPPGTYVDAFPLHAITLSSLDRLRALSGLDCSVGRFRPNLLLDTEDTADWPERAWIGHRLAAGTLEMLIHSPTLRCAMPSRPQPQLGLAAEPALTRALVNHCDRLIGVNAIVERGGLVKRGDVIRIVEQPPP